MLIGLDSTFRSTVVGLKVGQAHIGIGYTVSADQVLDDVREGYAIEATVETIYRTANSGAGVVEGQGMITAFPKFVNLACGQTEDVDVIITMPSIMGKIGALGRVLGPRGLMPNPKSGTVTMDVAKAVKEVKQGKIDFKVDKTGIVHTSIGKVSFTPEQICGNAKEFIATILKLKPSAAKGTYIKSIYLSSTMSKGIKVDPKTVDEI